MRTLYDSDRFEVVYIRANEPCEGESPPSTPREGFEIVNKDTNKEVYLDGAFAALFQSQIDAWQLNTPFQAEVEAVLAGYTELAQTPVVVH